MGGGGCGRGRGDFREEEGRKQQTRAEKVEVEGLAPPSLSFPEAGRVGQLSWGQGRLLSWPHLETRGLGKGTGEDNGTVCL